MISKTRETSRNPKSSMATQPHLVQDGESTEQDFSESPDESADSDFDDSQHDPTFTEALSGLSVHNNSSRVAKSDAKCKGMRRMEEDLGEVDDTDLGDEIDQKSFDCIQTLIKGGKLEKLKIYQCKVYLRKYGLRLMGNKDTLIERIKEHIRILNGGAEREYPPSTFVLNCKGDACMGDVVMFEQTVYEKYDLASRSGPPIGTRVITGRIVKESYGAAKQQHTFTIEVLWSKGEKPLPPLHPLLIKGRNLYRMKTLRQRWEDETLREKALRDKHSRGEAARTDREIRILKKKMKQELRGKKLPRMSKSNKNEAPLSQPARMTLQQNDNEKQPPMHRNQPSKQPDTVADGRRLESRNMVGAQSNHFLPQRKSHVKPSMTNNVHPHAVRVPGPAHRGFETVHSHRHGSSLTFHSQHHHPDKGTAGLIMAVARRPLATQNCQPPPTSCENTGCHTRPSQPANPIFSQHARAYRQDPMSQPCWYFAQGRCHFGSNCKFSHDI